MADNKKHKIELPGQFDGGWKNEDGSWKKFGEAGGRYKHKRVVVQVKRHPARQRRMVEERLAAWSEGEVLYSGPEEQLFELASCEEEAPEVAADAETIAAAIETLILVASEGQSDENACSRPPGGFESLYAIFGHRETRDSFLGDLAEHYPKMEADYCTRVAQWWFAKEVIVQLSRDIIIRPVDRLVDYCLLKATTLFAAVPPIRGRLDFEVGGTAKRPDHKPEPDDEADDD